MKTLFETEEIYSIPVAKPVSLHFNISNFTGPMICLNRTDLKDVHLTFLEKIVKAIGFELSTQCEIAVIEEDQKYALKQLIKMPLSRQIIVFGNFQQQFDLQFHVKLNEWTNIAGCNILFSYDLGALTDDQFKKQELWKALKTKFG